MAGSQYVQRGLERCPCQVRLFAGRSISNGSAGEAGMALKAMRGAVRKAWPEERGLSGRGIEIMGLARPGVADAASRGPARSRRGEAGESIRACQAWLGELRCLVRFLGRRSGRAGINSARSLRLCLHRLFLVYVFQRQMQISNLDQVGVRPASIQGEAQ